MGMAKGTRDLILRDDALLYVAYVMLIWAPLIPATRWSCRRPPADSTALQLHLVAGIRGAQISIMGLVLSASSPLYKVFEGIGAEAKGKKRPAKGGKDRTEYRYKQADQHGSISLILTHGGCAFEFLC